ncbi:hypothetical protein K491DRAFT_682567 [Lophiostoma macrostomum CBS 122681]|uniref:histone acetyltransferase n=1 Tax=Lophiostoma macrostomum CBS 122681 TaxID=1314788 RepID=A0A6A6STJ8_9PLEO|nr:hypothetical protein K491DRAFT_682567 [Lophiostoma macrostomum CBS 122681]
MAPNTTTSNGTPSKPVSKHSKDTKRPSSLDPNVLEVVFGTLLIKPWYPSFYPEELVGRRIERLYVCQWCFKYSKELMGFLGHLKCCGGQPVIRGGPDGDEGGNEVGSGSRRGSKSWSGSGNGSGNGNGDKSASEKAGMPGEEIYRDEARGISLWEIDGEEHKLYAQNLSLFAKLFLDTKSVFYDVTTFLYYVLVAHDPQPGVNPGVGGGGTGGGGRDEQAQTQTQAQKGGQVVGFFSKEKMSWDNNNLACILVFPPWQKQGLGQILMGASYEMSKREGRLGGPEKPLSELGRRAYVHYWATTLARVILAFPSRKPLSVLDLRNETYIVPEDIIATLQAMEVIEHRKRGGADAVINKAKVREWVERNMVDLRNPVDPEGFIEFEEGEGGGDEEMEE